MDNVWAAFAAFVLMASFYCRLLMAAKYRSHYTRLRWLGRSLVVVMLVAGGFLVTATAHGGN